MARPTSPARPRSLAEPAPQLVDHLGRPIGVSPREEAAPAPQPPPQGLRGWLARLRVRAEAETARPGFGERTREVWPRDEWKQIQRAMEMLRKRGIEVALRCDAPTCKRYFMTHHRIGEDIIVRCPHKDRVWTNKF